MDARLKPIEVAGQLIITTQTLAEGYGTSPAIISNNFNRNREHYAEGNHFYCLEGHAQRPALRLHGGGGCVLAQSTHYFFASFSVLYFIR